MIEIPLKVLIIDPDRGTALALNNTLRTIAAVLEIEICESVPEAKQFLETHDTNVVIVDPIGLGIDGASRFIFRIREQYPAIVFVLYYDPNSLKTLGGGFYAGERQRFRHYFFLEKSDASSLPTRQVQDAVRVCQAELSFNLSQEKIAGLQKELTEIEESASDDKLVVPRGILQEIREQLDEFKHEKRSSGPNIPAQFLGPTAACIDDTRCFAVMPYSQTWSTAVETILREVCDSVGLKFVIAKAMEGRFIPHDIWQGVTGSAVLIADLSGANANVAYEIGLADAIGREVILISQNTSVPFDFQGQRLIVYEDSVNGALSLRKELSERLTSVKALLSRNARKTG